MGILSSIFAKGEACTRCGQKSPLTGKGSRWEPIGQAPSGTPTGYRCRDCGTALQTQAAPVHGTAPGHTAPQGADASLDHPGASAARASDAAPRPVYTAENSIHVAAEVGDVVRVEYFLSHGESPAAPDPVGLQPLHYASNKGRIDVMRLLIDHGADPNAQGEQGLAPIHGAAYSGSLEAIRFLVDRGANVNIRTGAGATPLKMTRIKNQTEAAALLESLGGVE